MSLNAFLNPVKIENKKVVVSDRFVENGKPIEWEMKAITEEEDEKIRKSCIIKDKKGKRQDFDENLYSLKIITASVVYPDFENVELQNAYNVMGAENLLKKMLNVGEYMRLLHFVQELNGLNNSFDDFVDEAKN